MTANLTSTELLKVLATRFYLNVDLNKEVRQYEDWEYDQLVDEWEKENGGHNVKELVDWDNEYKVWREPVDPLAKEKYMPDEILKFIQEDYKGKKYHVNYKYDGCSVEAEYSKTGKLMRILGTPDEEFGIVRTEKLEAFFPKEVKPGIHRLFGEVLVETDKYGHLARNQANGACNSKYLQDKIDSECFVRCYNIEYYDKKYDYDRLINDLQELPVILGWRNDKYEVIFCQADELKPSDITGEPFIEEDIFIERPDYVNPEKKVHDVAVANFLVDGYVVYSEEGKFAYKMYYTEYKDVEIKEIDWAYNYANGSYVPTAVYDPIILNDKTNTRVALGGISKMMEEHRGIGAIVRVVMSGGTIPKIIKVLKGSDDFAWPVCECGKQLGPENQVASVLKCDNPECTLKLGVLKDELAYMLGWTVNEVRDENGYFLRNEYLPTGVGRVETLESYVDEDMFYPIRLLHVDRWKPEAKFKVVSDAELNCRLVDSVNKGFDKDVFTNILKERGLSDDLIGAGLTFLERYKEVHDDQTFDEAVNFLMNNLPKSSESENFEESYKSEIKAFINNPTSEKLSTILSKFFSMSNLQRKNADLNINSVVSLIKVFNELQLKNEN